MKKNSNIFTKIVNSRYFNADFRFVIVGFIMILFCLFLMCGGNRIISHVVEIHFPTGEEMQMMERDQKTVKDIKIEEVESEEADEYSVFTNSDDEIREKYLENMGYNNKEEK